MEDVVDYIDYRDILDSVYDIIVYSDIKDAVKRFEGRNRFYVLFDFLYKAADELESLGFDEFRDKFLIEDEIEKRFEDFEILSDDEKDDFSHKMDKFITEAKDFYESENLREFIDFRAKTAQLYELCKRQNIKAFDYASIINIVAISLKADFIGETRYENLLNRYGEKIMREFDSWEEFIASFTLGAIYAKSADKNKDEDDEWRDYYENNVGSVYAALVLPNDVFKMSGIWRDSVDSAKRKLIPVLENYLGEEKAREQKEKFELRIAYYERELGELRLDIDDFAQVVDIFYQDVYTEFKKTDSTYLFDERKSGRFVTPLIMLKGEADLCEATLKILNRQALKRDELPVELPIMAFKNTLVTTKAIYVQSGFLLFKKLKKISWADVNFSIKRLMFEEFVCKLNDEDQFSIPINADEDLLRNTNYIEEVKEQLAQDMKAFELAFENLKKRFG